MKKKETLFNEIEKRAYSSILRQQAYEVENAWWYYFFQAAGPNNYDAEYADHLRINGISPEIAAEQARI